MAHEPYAIFGFSQGALLGYLLVLELQARACLGWEAHETRVWGMHVFSASPGPWRLPRAGCHASRAQGTHRPSLQARSLPSPLIFIVAGRGPPGMDVPHATAESMQQNEAALAQMMTLDDVDVLTVPRVPHRGGSGVAYGGGVVAAEVVAMVACRLSRYPC